MAAQPTSDILLDSSDLRVAIATEIRGWKTATIGPDYDGKNACEVLTPDGQPYGNGFQYPPKGKLPLHYHTPDFHGAFALDEALNLARTVRLPTAACELPKSPEEIARLCLSHWRTTHPGPNPVFGEA